MDKLKAGIAGVVVFAGLQVGQVAFADASFQETTQITGGTLMDSMRQMAFMSKSIGNMFAPITTTTMVHGNQKAVVGKDSIEIYDLDKETVTRVDLLKKTYSVVTFAQMRQAMKDAPAEMQKAQDQAKPQQPAKKSDVTMSFDVKVNNTGVSKVVNGLTAQEQLVTMTMTATDPKAPANSQNSAAYVVTTDAWIAPDPPEVKEIQDFDMRFGKKMMEGVDMSAMMKQFQGASGPGMGMMFANQPGAGDAMAEMAKEMAKLHGTRVLEVTAMGAGGSGPIQVPGQGTGVAPTAAPAPPPPSKMGMLGSALGGSALGRFGKKSSTPPPDAAPADGSQAAASGVLMTTTMQKANFSRDAVPPSAFEVPAGFKLVESSYMKNK